VQDNLFADYRGRRTYHRLCGSGRIRTKAQKSASFDKHFGGRIDIKSARGMKMAGWRPSPLSGWLTNTPERVTMGWCRQRSSCREMLPFNTYSKRISHNYKSSRFDRAARSSGQLMTKLMFSRLWQVLVAANDTVSFSLNGTLQITDIDLAGGRRRATTPTR
jgi:hypothetical protein